MTFSITTLSITTLSITTLSITTLKIMTVSKTTLSIKTLRIIGLAANTQHKRHSALSVVMLNVIYTKAGVFYCYVEFDYAECLYSECRDAIIFRNEVT
jgi:hypothetical protein